MASIIFFPFLKEFSQGRCFPLKIVHEARFDVDQAISIWLMGFGGSITTKGFTGMISSTFH